MKATEKDVKEWWVKERPNRLVEKLSVELIDFHNWMEQRGEINQIRVKYQGEMIDLNKVPNPEPNMKIKHKPLGWWYYKMLAEIGYKLHSKLGLSATLYYKPLNKMIKKYQINLYGEPFK